MADADGGELVVGMENEGAVTGVPHAKDKVRLLLEVPKHRNYVTPPLPCLSRELSDSKGRRLLYFSVDWSPSVHLLADSRCLLRVGDSNQPFDKDKIKALKEAKHQGLFERTFPPTALMEDLDETLLTAFVAKVAPDAPPRDTLGRLHLVEGRNGHAAPKRADL